MKKRRCRKTALSSYYAWFSRDLLVMSSGVDTHTHTPTFADEMISRNQARSATCTWFNNSCAVLSRELKDIQVQ